MASDFTDFFKVNGEYTIRNLTVFITIAVGSAAIIYTAIADRLSAEIFGVYMFAGGGVYGFGKYQDEASRRSQIDATAEPDVSTTTINQPDAVNVGPTNKVTMTPKKGKK